jgi:tripartite-type tricarboxylate transporter receptor subunit TctC
MKMKKFIVVLSVIFSTLISVMLPNVVLCGEPNFPRRPLSVVLPFPPGGAIDMVSRGMQPFMEKYTGQPLIVLNKPGGVGLIAGNLVATSKPDGYKFGLFNFQVSVPEVFSSFRTAPSPYKHSDLVPVIRLRFSTFTLITKSDAPWANLDELISYAKKHPGKLSWVHQGISHPYYIKGVSLFSKAGVKLNPVPFKGSAAEIVAILGGKIDVAFTSVTAAKKHKEAGNIRMLGFQHFERLPDIPDVPTFKELGYDKGFPLNMSAFFVPKGTPENRIKILHDATKKVLEDDGFKDFMQKGAHNILYGTAEDTRKDLEQLTKFFGEIIKSPGFKD